MRLRLYSLLWWLLLPAVAIYLLARSLRQPEYRQGWLERLALGSVPNVEGGVWIHAVSVGETRAAQTLVRALRAIDPQLPILMTHMTPTGRATGIELFGTSVQRCYLPYDMLSVQRRFLRMVRPRCGLIMETELWPAMLHEAKRARIPMALVNARLSERSLARGLKRKALLQPALESLRVVLAQSKQDRDRIQTLGKVTLEVVGNMKFDHQPDAQKVALGRAWKLQVLRPIILVASSRDGEEALLLDAIRAHPAASEVQWWWVPRHPQRFDEVYALLQRQLGPRGVRRSTEAFLAGVADANWVLGDSMGEMGAYLEAADVVIMGGSLLPFGSQSLIEPCAQGRPVVLGPSTFNFAQAAEAALHAGAAVQVLDAAHAVDQALLLARDTQRRLQRGEAGRQMIASHQGATQRTVEALRDAGLV